MTPERMAELHATAFAGPSRWSADAFAAALAEPAVFAVIRTFGFALGRVVAGEAELLTLVVDQATRRRGTGRALLAEFDALARARGATEAFLEVADDNGPALALYAGAGWRRVGRRPGYYGGTDASILRKTL